MPWGHRDLSTQLSQGSLLCDMSCRKIVDIVLENATNILSHSVPFKYSDRIFATSEWRESPSYPLGQGCMVIVVTSCLRAACAGVRSSGSVVDEDALWVAGGCFGRNEGKRTTQHQLQVEVASVNRQRHALICEPRCDEPV